MDPRVPDPATPRDGDARTEPAPRATRLSAREAIDRLADPGSWRAWADLGPAAATKDPAYRAELERAAAATGSDEAVLVGRLHLGGVPAAILSWEFGFLGGSVGVATAARVVAAVRRATDEGLPLLALPRSGGTRMQEGTPAFVQMVAIAAAIAEHRRAGLAYLVHLCHPSTGGVLATLGSAGDLTTAEPGALVGFLGPRAYAAITGRPFPTGVQVAENLVAHGIVDEVLTWPALRLRWATVLGLWADARAQHGATSRRSGRDGGSGPAWGSAPPTGPRVAAITPGAPQGPEELWTYVQASRSPDRVDAGRFLDQHVSQRVELPGTGAGERASGVRVGLGRLGEVAVVFAATVDRCSGELLTVAGLRTARRGVGLAQRWGLPVVTVVDTLGAQLSVEGEQGGIAGEISRLLLDVVSAPTPTVAVLLGAGTGGAALSLLAVDRVVAASHAWVAPLPPEGAAAIRHDGAHVPAVLAWEQRVGVHALAELGFVDVVVRESRADWVPVLAATAAGLVAEVAAGVDRDRRVARFAAWSS